MAYTAPTATTNIQPSIESGARPLPVQQFCLDSITSTNRIVNPAANASLTYVLIPKAGKYACQVTIGLAGTAANVPNNVQLMAGADFVTSLAMVQAASTLAMYTLVLTHTPTHLGLQAINADPGDYVCTLTATAMNASG